MRLSVWLHTHGVRAEATASLQLALTGSGVGSRLLLWLVDPASKERVDAPINAVHCLAVCSKCSLQHLELTLLLLVLLLLLLLLLPHLLHSAIQL